MIWLLVSLSGSFWLLSKVFGLIALGVHKVLDHSLAELFAVAYNIGLAVLYSSVLVYASIRERGGKGDSFAFQAAGFVLVYLVLGATFSGHDGHVDEHALPGYWTGVLSYLFFCIRTRYLINPVTPRAYLAVSWLSRSGLGRWAPSSELVSPRSGSVSRPGSMPRRGSSR